MQLIDGLKQIETYSRSNWLMGVKQIETYWKLISQRVFHSMLVQSIATVRKKQKIINEINLPCVKCVREESKQSCNFPIVLVIDVFRVQMTKAVHNLLKDHNIFTCTKQYHISISRWTIRSTHGLKRLWKKNTPFGMHRKLLQVQRNVLLWMKFM